MQDLESQRESIEVEKSGHADPPQSSSAESATLAASIKEDDISQEDPAPDAKLYPETDLDQGIVGWDGQDDPANPQNFPAARKWSLLVLMSSMTFISPLASSMFAPAVSFAAVDLNVTNETLLSFSVSIFLLGYTVSWSSTLHSNLDLWIISLMFTFANL